ncbi:MAG TPA: S8 family serine peptidase [Mycobacteriales bacterium]|nr:S8 family serine peptidase [Mycobacteriales bacterium]
MPRFARRATAAAVLAVTAAAIPAAAATAARPARGPLVTVLVSGTDAHALPSVERAVRSAGGHVRSELKVIDGVSASVPSGSLAALRSAPGVRAVTADAHGHLLGVDSTLGYDVANDEGSLYDVAQITHAKDAWGAGWTGKGVDVALIDSGVSPVKGLTSGNVINGPDLSFESQDPDLAHVDTFGHGTHMASIIAGRDQAASGGTYANQGSHLFVGLAPDSRLVSIKVASSDGGADVSQVIAAIDWVTQNAKSGGLNIKVLNLSYGTDSTQDASVDPLDYAVENAWRAGITVVVSGGNDGSSRTALADPANDPLVLAVGADDPRNTDSVGDDQVPSFSQHGTASRGVDVIAPGVHILGLRDPGSFLDQRNSSAVVNNRFFRGSGTSQAAAVVSGLVALYAQKYPNATPDQIKYALMHSASAPSSVKSVYAGLGVPDINKAIGAKLPVASQTPTGATGTGSLEAARGSSHVTDGTSVLTGEQDIFGQAWNPTGWSTASATGSAWSGGSWNGSQWTGSAWTGSSWTGSTWSGSQWTGSSWSGSQWSGHQWSGHQWTADGWDGHAWTDSQWDGSSWSGSTWSGSTWSSSTWS